MITKQLTWNKIKAVAPLMFNIMGTNKEIAFAHNVWQKLSQLNLTAYSTNLELVKLKIQFVALGVLYKDFCKVTFEKQTAFNYNDLLKVLNIDEFTLGRFYQETIKPRENKLPDDFNASKALEELTEYFRTDIFQLLFKFGGSSFRLFILLWRAAYPYSDEDNLTDIELFYNHLTPAKSIAYNWIENGCYILLDRESEF